MEHARHQQPAKKVTTKARPPKVIQSKRLESSEQVQHITQMNNAPLQQKQRDLVSSMNDTTETAQLAGVEEEEMMQGKFTTQLEAMEDEELLQGKFAAQLQGAEEEELMQGKFVAVSDVSAPLQRKSTLPDGLKSGIEQLSGTDMSGVNVHYNSPKPAQLSALAYAQGSDIHLGPGQEQHLPHESWHVAQQREGRVSPTTSVNGQPVNDNTSLETEADVMGAKASRLS